MKIHCNITEDDIYQAMSRSRERFKFGVIDVLSLAFLGWISFGALANAGKKMLAIGDFVIAQLVSTGGVDLASLGAHAGALTAALPGLVFLAFIWALIIRMRFDFKKGVSKSSIQFGTATGPHSYEFTEAGVTTTTPRKRSVISWTKYRKIEITADAIILFLKECGFEVIPKRVFSNAEEADAFAAQLRGMRENYTGPVRSQGKDGLTVRFEPRDADIADYNLISASRRFGALGFVKIILFNKVVQLSGMILIGLMFFFSVWQVLESRNFSHAPVAAFFGVMLTLVVAPNPYLRSVLMPWRSRKRRIAFGDNGVTTVTLSDRRMRIEESAERCDYSWAVFSSITSAKRSLLFFFPSGNAFVIPNRAFLNEDHKRDFLEFAEKCIARPKHKSDALPVEQEVGTRAHAALPA